MRELRNTLVMPFRFYRPDLKVAGEMYCPDDRFYLVDEKGRVHCFSYTGKIPRPEDPGYEPAYVLEGDELPLEKYFADWPSSKSWWGDE